MHVIKKRHVAVMAAISIVAALGAIHAATGASGRRTLRYSVKFSPLSVVDLPPKGYSRGDEIVSNDRFFTGSGAEAGYDSGACVLTSTTPLQAECTFTFVLQGGTLTAQFSNSPPPRKHFAITGGTGSFADARGTGTIVESGRSQGGTASFTLSR